MLRRCHLALALAFAFLAVNVPSGQAELGPTATVVGAVTDATGLAVAGITVTLSLDSTPNVPVRTIVTSADGRFRFAGVTPGTYRVVASREGFTTVSRGGILVSASQTATLALVLPDGSPGRERGGRGRATPPPPPPPPPPPLPLPPVAFSPDAAGPPAASPVAGGLGLAVVPVFYATDRARRDAAPLDYGSVRNPKARLSMGRYDVSIPREAHEIGEVERPTFWTLYREDPAKHFVIVARAEESYDAFYNDIRRVVAASTRKDAFVFIHGFNVAFEDAVFRTAQMAYDLKFDGAPILYSWPSDTGETPIGYTAAENNNDWTVAHLDYFLRDVAARTGASRIHLIAHSMGNRALVNALNRLPLGAATPFNQIVLTAPDMDAQTFVQLSDAVKRDARRTTLYASASDKALLISKKLNGYPRAGDTGPGVVIVPGIDTVDVTAVDTNFVGHFYYSDNRSVLSDIFLLLTQGLPPTSRPALRINGLSPRQFWKFVP